MTEVTTDPATLPDWHPDQGGEPAALAQTILPATILADPGSGAASQALAEVDPASATLDQVITALLEWTPATAEEQAEKARQLLRASQHLYTQYQTTLVWLGRIAVQVHTFHLYRALGYSSPEEYASQSGWPLALWRQARDLEQIAVPYLQKIGIDIAEHAADLTPIKAARLISEARVARREPVPQAEDDRAAVRDRFRGILTMADGHLLEETRMGQGKAPRVPYYPTATLVTVAGQTKLRVSFDLDLTQAEALAEKRAYPAYYQFLGEEHDLDWLVNEFGQAVAATPLPSSPPVPSGPLPAAPTRTPPPTARPKGRATPTPRHRMPFDEDAGLDDDLGYSVPDTSLQAARERKHD